MGASLLQRPHDVLVHLRDAHEVLDGLQTKGVEHDKVDCLPRLVDEIDAHPKRAQTISE